MMSAAPPADRAPVRRSPGAGLRALLPASTIVAVALVTTVAASTAVARGATPLLLARVVARLALDLSWSVVLGALVLILLVRPPAARSRDRLCDVAAVAAGVAAVAAAATAFLLYVGQAPSPASPAFGPGLVAFLSEIAVGRAWLVAAILAAVLSAALVAVRSIAGLVVVAALAVAGVVPVALQSATSDGTLDGTRTTGAAALVLLLATATWIGAHALLPLAGPVRRGGIARALAPACAVLAITGILLGGVPLLPLGLPLAAVLAVAAVVAGRRPGRPVDSGLLGLAGGLAVVARVLQAAPTAAANRTSPAEILTGAPLPPAPSALVLLTDWRPDAVWLVLSAVLLAGYGLVLLRLRRSGRPWPAARTAAWTAAVLLLVWCTSGGPAVYGAVLLSAHLGQHAALALPVPLLLAAGAPLRLLRAVRPAAPAGAARGPLDHPLAATALAAAAFLALYATPLLRWSVTDAVGAEWAELQCLLTGGLLVAAVLRAPRRAALVSAALLLLVETAGALLLGTGGGLLLADWYGAMGWGTDALVDQRTGAAVAWAITAACTLVLLATALRRPAAVLRLGSDRPLPPAERSEVPA